MSKKQTTLKRFELSDICIALGINTSPETQQCNELFAAQLQEQISDNYEKAIEKMDKDMVEGMTNWLTMEIDGISAVYHIDANGTTYVSQRTILNEQSVGTYITGGYNVSGHEVSIMLDRDYGSPLVSTRVFLDNKLIASRTDPHSFAGQYADAFLRQLYQNRGDDISPLDETLSAERSPYLLALKMLSDYMIADVDQNMVQAMFAKMQDKMGINVMNRDYA